MKFPSIFKLAITAFFIAALYGCGEDEQPIDCGTNNLAATAGNVSDATCGLDNGSFELSISGGSGPFEFSISGSAFQNVASGITVIEGVTSGNHVITVQDAISCTVNTNVNIANSNNVALDTEVTASGCETANGTIVVNASGGKEPYSFSLDGGSAQMEHTFTGLTKGDYTALVTDDDGCQTSVTIGVMSGTSYNNEIIPIINAKCAAVSGCHDGNSSPPNWTDLATLQANAENVKNRTTAGTMPPAGQPDLEPSEIQAIACWVDDGALNN